MYDPAASSGVSTQDRVIFTVASDGVLNPMFRNKKRAGRRGCQCMVEGSNVPATSRQKTSSARLCAAARSSNPDPDMGSMNV